MNAERTLKVVVIAMAVLIFALLGVVVWRIGTLADDGDGAAGSADPVTASGAASAAAPGLTDLSLDLAPGCRIAATTADSGRLVVRTTGPVPACDAVYVFDLATGGRLGTIGP